MRDHRRSARRTIALAVLGAVAAHAVLLAVIGPARVSWRLPAIDGAAPPPASAPVDGMPVDVSVVALVDPANTPPPLAVWGPGDLAGFAQSHPLPAASVDRPGDRAADRGGGAAGGPALWTGRRDDPADATLLAEPWNDGRDYRAAHDRLGARAASREALHRTPAPASGDRANARLARDGGDVASRGGAVGQGAGDDAAAWRDADPRFGLRPGRDQAVRADGATRPTRDPVLAERGATSADVTVRGAATRDREAVAAASRETVPDPYDLTPVQAGGADRGVRGAAGAGALPDGRGTGDGATRADAAHGARDLAIEARRQDPYFRRLYGLLDRAVVFPRDLAVDLRSGRSVARLVLAADGSISDIALHASSGFRGFDDELVRALGTLPPLPPVPATLLGGRSALHVRVVYEFQNPVVR